METTTQYIANVEGPNNYGFFTVTLGDDTQLSTKKGELAAAAREIKANGAKALIAYSETQKHKDGRTYTNRYLEGIQQDTPHEEQRDSSGRKIQMTEENVRLTAMGLALKILEGRGMEFTANNIIGLSEWVVAYAWRGPDGVVTDGTSTQFAYNPLDSIYSETDKEDIPF